MPHQRKEMSATEHRSMGIHEANGWSVIQCACGWQYQSDCHTREELQHFYEEHRVASRREPAPLREPSEDESKRRILAEWPHARCILSIHSGYAIWVDEERISDFCPDEPKAWQNAAARVREPGRDEGESKLLPCPFCNSEPSIDETKGVCWIVYCPNDECDIRPETGFQQTREEAIYNWNRRAPSESQSLRSQLAADDERMWEMAHQVAVLQQKLATAGEVIEQMAEAMSDAFKILDGWHGRPEWKDQIKEDVRTALQKAEEFRKGIGR